MAVTILRIFFTVLMLFNAAAGFSQSSEQKKVIATYEGYKKALLNNNGKKILRYVDDRTFEYYERVLLLARSTDSSEMKNMPMLEMLMVISIRNRIPEEETADFDGKKLFEYVVNKGMVSKRTVAKSTISDVEINGNHAAATLLMNGKTIPINLDFYKYGNAWKFDFTSISRALNSMFTP